MKCQYKYKHDTQKKCPHNALPDSKLCFWHEEKDGKDLHWQKLKEKDLKDAYTSHRHRLSFFKALKPQCE
jgi:hypothetical protein